MMDALMIIWAVGIWAVIFGIAFAITIWLFSFIEDYVRYRLALRKIKKGWGSKEFTLPLMVLPENEKVYPTIYDEMMANPQMADELLVEKKPFPSLVDDIYDPRGLLNKHKDNGASK